MGFLTVKWLIKGALSVAFLLALLASCTSTTPDPQPGTEPEPLDMTALVIGAVNSPVFDELAKRVQTERYDGSQAVEEYDLLILDGDTHTPQALNENKLVAEAWQSGKWVLAVDVNHEHKRTGLGDHLHIASKHVSPSYLFRKIKQESGRTLYRIIDSSAPELFTQPDPEVFARSTLSALQTGSTETQCAASPDTDIPVQVVNVAWCVTNNFLNPYKLPGSAKNSSGSQTMMAQLNHTISVLLDNANNPGGNFQYVVVQTDARANPTNGTSNFVNMTYDEKAWFLGQFVVTTQPDSNTTNPFSWVKSDPQTTNSTTTYTASSGFSLGFAGLTGTGGYSWGTSKSYDLQDWKVSSNGGGVVSGNWNFRSGNPDTDAGYGSCDWTSCGVFKSNYPLSPNALSTGENDLIHTSITYKTASLETGWRSITMGGTLTMADTYCGTSGGRYGQCISGTGSWKTYDVSTNYPAEINLGAAIPVPVQSIDFDNPVVTAGDNTWGTVTLEKPALIDVIVELSTNSDYVTPPKTQYVIPQGDDSVRFCLETGPNGGDAGSTFTVKLIGFYTQNYNALLEVQNPPSSVTPQNCPTNPEPVPSVAKAPQWQ